VWAGCRCRVITTLKTRVALAHPTPPSPVSPPVGTIRPAHWCVGNAEAADGSRYRLSHSRWKVFGNLFIKSITSDIHSDGIDRGFHFFPSTSYILRDRRRKTSHIAEALLPPTLMIIASSVSTYFKYFQCTGAFFHIHKNFYSILYFIFFVVKVSLTISIYSYNSQCKLYQFSQVYKKKR